MGVALVASVSSAGTAVSEPTSYPLAAGIPLARELPASTADKVSPRLAPTGKVTAFVELSRRAGVDAFNEETSRGTGRDRARQAAQRAAHDVNGLVESLTGTLRARDASARVLYTTTNVVAGMAVTANAPVIRELAARAEVESIRPIVPKERTNASAVQLTRTLNTWQQTGKLGDGVRIGVIDDGVDYTHAAFGGPGTPQAYGAIDRTKVQPGFFPTAKVVGGADLAGDDYDSTGRNGSPTPVPDPNPIACGEHGTHVAATAAGFGVNADGGTFRGDYTKLTTQALGDMHIGPGTAPKALIYAIKVFGCAGSTDLTAQALDWALDPDGDNDFADHLDVVNLSLGSDFGAPDDPDSLFVRKLARNNVLAVISGGNGGDRYDVGGSPGSTPEALTVASTRDAYVLRDAVEIKAPAGTAGGQYSQAYPGYDKLDETKPVVAVQGSNSDGCDPFTEPDKAKVAGKFVWLEWDASDASRRCGSAVRTDNARDAGATGVLLSSATDHFAAGIAGNDKIPVFQFTATATEPLRPALRDGTLQVRMAGAMRVTLKTRSPEIVDTPSTFTSRGVRAPAVKPDVAAPGDTIASALRGSGAGTLVISGTSMAAPHVAGVAALVRQAHPDWTPEEVKAAVMNTAGGDVHTEQNGPVVAPQRTGAGRVDARSAVDVSVLAMGADDPGAVSVSFGTVEVAGPMNRSKAVRLVNKSARAAEFTVGYREVTRIPGVRYEFPRGTVHVPPHSSSFLRVTLRIDDPSALRKTIDPSVSREQNGLARQFVADASGILEFKPKNGNALRLPVYAAPRPVSRIMTDDRVSFKGKPEAVLPLRGKGLDQGKDREAYRSLISVLELQATSPRLPSCRRTITTGCTVNDTAKGGDLRYVGVASTAPRAVAQGKPDEAVLAFGISTWGDWYNLGSNTVPFVDIDTTGDGKADFESFVSKITGTDVWVVNTVDLVAPGAPSVARTPLNGTLGDVDTALFDNNVVVLPVPLKALRIDPTSPSARISYTVGVAGYYTAPGDETGLVDSLPGPLSFDPVKPGLRVTGQDEDALLFLAKPGTALTVRRDQAAFAADRSDGLLVLSHHNASGSRAAVVRVPAT